MNDLVRIIRISEKDLSSPEVLLNREWLVTNGLGGYASGTVAGINTRRYHGLLIAALPTPLGRMLMFNQLAETLIAPDGSRTRLNGEERISCSLQMHGNCFLSEFRLENGLPVWLYKLNDVIVEKRLFMRYMQNTVQISWKLLSSSAPVILEFHPTLHFRSHSEPVDAPLNSPYTITIAPGHYELSAGQNMPVLRMLFEGPEVTFTISRIKYEKFVYRQEESQGYPAIGALWGPGYFQVEMKAGQEITLVASTDTLETVRAFTPQEAFQAEVERREILLGTCHSAVCQGIAAELVLAADQFIITPAGRQEDTARIRASGDEVRTIIAGYHWFTDWGRDTMISLEGLTLLTGRHLEARWILHTFARYVRRGLVPNMFPESQNEGIYNTADATLWFFHALDRYLEYTGDRTTLRILLPRLLDIIEHHIRGTDFGIKVDPADGLLRQGADNYALTWMDAKVGNWVVTPRRGKTVEINALWYNALRLMEGWISREMSGKTNSSLVEMAGRVHESFNKRFWYAPGNYLYDIVDGEKGDDSTCRPNQLLAMSLRFPVLDKLHWEPVVKTVTRDLLTPFGLRSLCPGEADYKTKYFGDIHARDAAYHQGTVWAWLIGPFIDSWLKVYPERKAEARHFLEGFLSHLSEACVGSISEIFDADAPFTPRGCIAQAWSVAEVIRSWVNTAE